jgi:hypothetical protein
MAFDSPTRNKLQRMVGACRRLLADEFDDQLQGLYGIYAQDGRVLELEKLTSLDDDHHQTATLLRDRINHLTSGMPAEKQPLAEAVRRVLREQAFTLLNRFAALRMAEERGFVQECVGQGLKSKGFQVFETVARSGLGGAYERYVTFIHGMFDELSLDLGVLFDRWSPFGLLFPREPALIKFFELLNDPELKPLWKEDETIGWIYQYFNDEAERKKMREESAAPRNSRELAVRNQFFTPRYVVEFLTDNTLGRIWYEMTQGETKLKEQCRYLVRRPNEIFLKLGEAAPEQQTPPATASQEDLLKQPVHIPHRPIKDPRTILMLDPACGSMHFGLYAFDLFEVIYEEAWELEKGGAEFQSRQPGMLSLQESYGTKEDFLKDVPRLIIEQNLHGIDIDPRCAQIAGLSLWLRAQKAWQRLGLKPAERPAIKRSNIVCAEPMPGEKELLREFVEREFPAEERGVCLRLLEAIFDKMQLAGEAGSLLKIEEEIRSAIEDARQQWQTARQRPEFFDADQLATLDKRAGAQQELPAAERASIAADLRSLTSEDFWQRIEERIYAALRDYAEQAENGGGFQRRLFAEDAARGFAFIDVCRKRYDVALMNPPFGSPADGCERITDSYSLSPRDIYGMFVERTAMLQRPAGLVGAILPRTGLFIGTMSALRKDCYLGSHPIQLLADLGKDVLDGATIRTACYVIGKGQGTDLTCFRLGNIPRREDRLLELLATNYQGEPDLDLFRCDLRQFTVLPSHAIAYWIPQRLVELIRNLPKLESVADIRQGIFSGDNFRFLRLFHELPAEHGGYSPFSKGGEPVAFLSDEALYIRTTESCAEMKALAAQEYGSASRTIKNEETFGKSGITYSQVNDACLKFRAHPSGGIYDMKGPVLFTNENLDRMAMLCLVNSSAVEDFMRMMTDGRQWHVSSLKNVPLPPLGHQDLLEFAKIAQTGVEHRWRECCHDETGHFYYATSSEGAQSTCASQLEDLQGDIDARVWRSFGATAAEVGSFARQRELFLEREIRNAAVQFDTPRDRIGIWVGTAFGRWDIRYATGERAAPELPDPFAPLPVCPPGQLQNAQGLPARPEDVPAAYPVRIPWAGILVDDPNHPLDIERRVREVIEIIWTGSAGGPTAEAIEHEACEILGVKSFRDYFRKPAGFFADHLKRYSKSRRQAPIYWPLSTASGSYMLWIYYHRLTDQTLFQCVNEFVKPKLQDEVMPDIERLRAAVQREGGGSKEQREKLEALEDFAIELKDFHDELLRVAGLPYKPNLNDGVLITASPLWKLFRLPKWQKDLKACWESLEGEEYEWAHLAYTIWPDRVKKVCKKDRSIAIAHGLEELCEVKTPEKKAKRGKKKADAELALEGGNE